MNINYNDLFKTLVNAYYDDSFDAAVNDLLCNFDVDKTYLCKAISSLCGVQLDYCENYSDSLRKAISNYNPKHKVVNKIKDCAEDCLKENPHPFCETSCPFEAITSDLENNTIIIDNSKCIDCGFCVTACPNQVLADTIEFIPLINLLDRKRTF